MRFIYFLDGCTTLFNFSKISPPFTEAQACGSGHTRGRRSVGTTTTLAPTLPPDLTASTRMLGTLIYSFTNLDIIRTETNFGIYIEEAASLATSCFLQRETDRIIAINSSMYFQTYKKPTFLFIIN